MAEYNGLADTMVICIAAIGHFTVVCLVTWPRIESEAGGDLVTRNARRAGRV